jgi:pimeloyl-ACP methyl ester carboxylesterase
MESFAELGSWISENESLLSGMAALIVLAGVILSPLGIGIRRLVSGGGDEPAAASAEPFDARAQAPSPTESGQQARLTFRDLTAPSPYETRFAKSDGLRIAYNERGSGPANLVMAPGIVSHLNISDQLPSQRDTLNALAGFARVVHFDKRGQGLSDPTLHTPDLEERVRDIEAVMDASGTERAILMGVSEGGPMCLHFAYTHPDRVQGLILLGSTPSWVQREDFPIGIPRQALELLTTTWGTGKGRQIFFPSLSREQVDDETYRLFERTIATRDATRGLVNMMIETDVRPLLPHIQVPALVVHYAGDLAVPIRLGRALAEGLPNAEFMEINAVDHGDLSHSPEAIERIRTFCEEITSAQA